MASMAGAKKEEVDVSLNCYGWATPFTQPRTGSLPTTPHSNSD